MTNEEILKKIQIIHNENMKVWNNILAKGTFQCTAFVIEPFAYDMNDQQLSNLCFDIKNSGDKNTLQKIHSLYCEELPVLVKLCTLGIQLKQIHEGLAAKADKAIQTRIGDMARNDDRSYVNIILDAIPEEDKTYYLDHGYSYLRKWMLIKPNTFPVWENEYGGVNWHLFWEKLQEQRNGTAKKDTEKPKDNNPVDFIGPNGRIDYKKLAAWNQREEARKKKEGQKQ